MVDELDIAIGKFRRYQNIDTRKGFLGDGTGSGDPRVHDNSGRMWVRFQLSGRYTAPVALPLGPNAAVIPSDGMAVEVGYDRSRRQCILGVYAQGLEQSGTNPGVLNPLDDQAYGSTSTSDISQFLCKRHGDTANYPMSVVVLPGYIEIAGVSRVFAPDEDTGVVDLTSFIPDTGEKCIVCIYLQDDMTLTAYASTPVLLSDPILETHINECRQQAAAQDVSIWGWILEGDQTILTEDITRNIDLRPWMNSPATGGGTTDLNAQYLACLFGD